MKDVPQKKNILSGIQPSGKVHLGNYLGAIRQWVDFQDRITDDDRFLFTIVDLHSITVQQDPKALRASVLDLAAWFIASGLDPKIAHIFVQSENPDHPYLTWILDCITPMGWLERMTQYKDKSDKQGERTSVGLFHYPNLMAADILLYDTSIIPVGEDQVQHVELTRDIAKKFNHTFGDTFVLPNVQLMPDVARVMSLQDPTSKMSKSDDNGNSIIYLSDSADQIASKIRKAVTDSGDVIAYGKDKPALSNLISIYASCTGESHDQIVEKYTGKGYGQFKGDLAEVLIDHLKPIQTKYEAIMSDTSELHLILDKGIETARSISSKKIADVTNAVGLGR